jgi:putative acyl-CoA dehydrogenase
MGLDVLRAARKHDEVHAVLDSLAEETKYLPGAIDAVDTILTNLVAVDAEAKARSAVEQIFCLAAAAALATTAPDIAENFMRIRSGSRQSRTYGTGDVAGVASRLLDRALPST